MATVSNDSVDVLARFAARRPGGMVLLSDPKAEIIAAFDLINPQFAPGTRWHGVALPMLFVIDAAGVITHRLSDSNYRWRPQAEDVVELLRGTGG